MFVLLSPVQADNPLQIEQAFAAYNASDYSQALRLFKPLAQQGNAEAQNSLGVMYAKGQGVAQDYQQALAWYKKAAIRAMLLRKIMLAGCIFTAKAWRGTTNKLRRGIRRRQTKGILMRKTIWA